MTDVKLYPEGRVQLLACRNSLLFSVIAVMVLGLATTAPHAQPAPGVDDVKGEVDRARRPNSDPFAKSVQKAFGISVGDWIILPELTVGALYDTNVFASRVNPKGGWGINVQPVVAARRDTGIHDTKVYVFGNFSILPELQGASTVSGAANLKHVYEIERGLTLTYLGEVARLQDQASVYSQTRTGAGYGPGSVEPITYMNYASSLDIDKSFNDVFLAAGGNILAYEYDNTRTTTGVTLPQTGRNLVEYSGHARAGLRFLSDIYAFVQPSVTQYDFQTGPPATGYALIGGVGSDHLSLFRGEIFAGYQTVKQGSGVQGNHDLAGATFGGRVSWTPIRDLIVTLAAEQLFAPSTVITGSVGYFTHSDTVTASVTYGFSRQISLDAKAVYSNVAYSVGSRDDKISQFGFDGTYYFTDSMGLRFEYAFTNVNSNQPIYEYDRNRVVLGLHMRL